MTDPRSDLQRRHSTTLQRRASVLADITGSDPESDWERHAVAAMFDSVLPAPLRSRPARLIVTLDSRDRLDASILGRVADAIQRGTAKLASSRIEHRPVTIASAAVRRKTPLTLLPSPKNTLIFDLAEPLGADRRQDLMTAEGESWAELAAADLCESLPVEPSMTEQELNGLLSANQTVKSAVRSVIDAPISGYLTGISLQGSGGSSVSGWLSPQDVQILREQLHVEVDEQRKTEFIDGFLDGSRGRRRIFYLDTKSNAIEGGIAPNIVDDVRSAEGSTVRIQAEVVRRPGRRTLYTLIGLERTLKDPAEFKPDEG